MLKPESAARLFTAIGRVRQRIAASTPPARLDAILAGPGSNGVRSPLCWINATVGQSMKLISVDEVLYFQADNKYTRIVTRDGEALIRKSLKEPVDKLDGQEFWQIHRSTVVNALAVASVSRDFRGHLLVRLKERSDTLPVSDSYSHLFRQM